MCCGGFFSGSLAQPRDYRYGIGEVSWSSPVIVSSFGSFSSAFPE
jgi:hypothetical protein